VIIVDIIIVLMLVQAAISGHKRGLIHLIFELVCLLAATATAFFLYQVVGSGIRNWVPLSVSLTNTIAFVVLWIMSETIYTLVMWSFVLARIKKQFLLQEVNEFGGAVLGVAKTAVILIVALLLFAGLPLQATIKRAVTDAYIPNVLLTGTGLWQTWMSSNLGRDIGDTLNFYTVPANADSEVATELGFSTTDVKVSASSEEALLGLINHERADKSLPLLKMNEKTRLVARKYAIKMLAGGYFSHVDLQGNTPYIRLREGGVVFDAAGENLASAPTVQLAHQGLMNSKGHRDNILSPYFSTVGIGVVDAGPYGIMVVEDFTD